MRYLKSILIALVLSVIVLGGIGLTLNPIFKVERSLVISSPKDSIFPYVENLRRWPDWTVWNISKDPSLKFSFAGPDKGAGSQMRWEGDALENGEIVVSQLMPGKKIMYDISLEEGFRDKGSLTLESNRSKTKVTWVLEGNVGTNIPQRYFILFMDKFAGPDMEVGLNNLKKLCESK
jgi:hypothetical protein